jgi:uncharacterized protein
MPAASNAANATARATYRARMAVSFGHEYGTAATPAHVNVCQWLSVGGAIRSACMDRVALLIGQLGLQPHPEGGFYRQIFRSSIEVMPQDGRDRRPALTTIYFLLPKGAHSRWHRVRSDEVWHFYEGAPLELWQLSPGLDRLDRVRLGPFEEGQRPAHTVPAEHWQAAQSAGDYTLVGCSVGPGFEFDDFEMMRADSPDASRVCGQWPEAARLL